MPSGYSVHSAGKGKLRASAASLFDLACIGDCWCKLTDSKASGGNGAVKYILQHETLAAACSLNHVSCLQVRVPWRGQRPAFLPAAAGQADAGASPVCGSRLRGDCSSMLKACGGFCLHVSSPRDDRRLIDGRRVNLLGAQGCAKVKGQGRQKGQKGDWQQWQRWGQRCSRSLHHQLRYQAGKCQHHVQEPAGASWGDVGGEEGRARRPRRGVSGSAPERAPAGCHTCITAMSKVMDQQAPPRLPAALDKMALRLEGVMLQV